MHAYEFVDIRIQFGPEATANDCIHNPHLFALKTDLGEIFHNSLLAQMNNVSLIIQGQVVIHIKLCNTSARPHTALIDPGGAHAVLYCVSRSLAARLDISGIELPWQR